MHLFLYMWVIVVLMFLLLFVTEKMLIRDKLAYPGSLSASLSQELIAAYPWLAYPVAYPVVASWRCAAASGSAAGGGSPAGGGSAAAAPRQRRRLGAGCGLKAGGAVAGGGQLGGRRLGGQWLGGGRRAAARRRRLGNGGASEPVRRLAAWRPAARRRRRPGNGGASESVRRLLVV